MQLSPAAVEGQRQHGRQGRQAEPEVCGDAQPGMVFSQNPQAVVVQPQAKTQGAGVQKLEGLRLQGILHQPSSRLKKPPCRGAPS